MSDKTKAVASAEAAAAEKEAKETAAAKPAATEEDVEQQRRKELEEYLKNRLPDPCVYCGPSVRNVARQFTVYNGGLPEAVKEFILEYPAVKGLLVPAERFAAVRTKLEKPGTAENILFNKVKASISAPRD